MEKPLWDNVNGVKTILKAVSVWLVRRNILIPVDIEVYCFIFTATFIYLNIYIYIPVNRYIYINLFICIFISQNLYHLLKTFKIISFFFFEKKFISLLIC